MCLYVIFFFKQKTAYEMRISDWSSDVCSSDLLPHASTRECPVAFIRRKIMRCGSPAAACRRCPKPMLISLMPQPPSRRRSEEHTSELQSLIRISYAVFCLEKKDLHPNRIPASTLKKQTNKITMHNKHYN